MPYFDVLKYVKRSKCVLNIAQENVEGLTLRDFEAIGMGKYLITNNAFLKTTQFYVEENVVWLDDLIHELSKFKKNEPPIWNNRFCFSKEDWISWENDVLKTKRDIN